MKNTTNFMGDAPKRVLILEDNVAEASALSSFLELQGWQAVVAQTPAEAIATLQACTVAVCDIYLGEGGSGIEAARTLLRQADVPIVFMSARSDTQTLDEALAVSSYGFLVKPFRLEDLLTTLQVAIARHARDRRDRARVAQLQDKRLAVICQIRQDMGAPLAAIGLTLARLRQQGRALSGAQFEACLSRIDRSVQSLWGILDGCVEQLYQESVRRPLQVRSISPQFFQEDLCLDIIDELAAQTKTKKCPIVFCFENTTDAIALDVHAVRVILRNLLTNAVQYSHPGQSIRLHVQVTPQTVQLQVGDRGLGMPPEFMNEVFELFSRAENVQGIPGSGVGLHVVKEAVELHQGTLTMESTLNQGSIFTVTLPNFTNPDLGQLAEPAVFFHPQGGSPKPSGSTDRFAGMCLAG